MKLNINIKAFACMFLMLDMYSHDWPFRYIQHEMSLMTCKSRMRCHEIEMLLLESRMRGYTARQLPTNQRLPSLYDRSRTDSPNLISFVATLVSI